MRQFETRHRSRVARRDFNLSGLMGLVAVILPQSAQQIARLERVPGAMFAPLLTVRTKMDEGRCSFPKPCESWRHNTGF